MKSVKKDSLNSLLYILLTVLFIFSLINISLLTARTKKVKEVAEIAQELRRPALLEATKIVPLDCNDCYDVERALAAINGQNVNITSERTLRFDSKDAKSLIRLHRIEKIPAIVVTGEINKTEHLRKFFESNGRVTDNTTAVYANIRPPYYDVKKGEVVGRVTIVQIIDSSCKECRTLGGIVAYLKQVGVGIVEDEAYEYDSMEGNSLIHEYNISRVPALLISRDISFYPEVKQQLVTTGAQLQDEYYAVHALAPPYRDVKENRIVGRVDIIMLKDDACKECYDVGIHKQILTRMELAITKEDTVSVSSDEGKELLKKYTILRVPTIILRGDLEAYPFFTQIWPQAGSVEDDGSYIFRHLSVLGPGIKYKDLMTGEIIENKSPQQQEARSEEGAAEEGMT